MPTETKKPRCKKCGSWIVRRDYDPVCGVIDIYCVKCGNRFPGGLGFEMAARPVRKKMDGRESVRIGKAGEMTDVSNPAPSIKSGKEKPMPKVSKKTEGCTNCLRPLGLVGGLCYTCRKTAQGLKGPARLKALQEAKRRIDAGEVVRGGSARSREKHSDKVFRKILTDQSQPAAACPPIQPDHDPAPDTLPTRGEPCLTPAMEMVARLEQVSDRDKAIKDAIFALAGALGELVKTISVMKTHS